MNEIAISDFKATCIERLKTVAATDEELVVTLRGKPLARIVPVAGPAPRRLGGQSGACVPTGGDWKVLMESDLEDDWS